MKELDLFGAKKNNSSKTVTLYHGTTDSVLTPTYGKGKKENDYGQGFYTTPDFRLACEWACGRPWGAVDVDTGYVHAYSFNLDGLQVFDFRNINKYTTLYWITELLQHRRLPSD